MPQPPARASAPSMLISAAAFVVVVAGMRAAQPLVVPFLLAVFISILSAPALLWLEARHIPRPLALLVVIAAIIAAGFALTALVGTSLADFSRNLPQYKIRLVGQAGRAEAAPQWKVRPGGQEHLPSPASGWAAGGEMPIEPGDPSRTTEPFFEVHAALPAHTEATLVHGRSGKIRFDLDPEPLLPRWLRRLYQLLQKRYQI